jgi:hypothetical protein
MQRTVLAMAALTSAVLLGTSSVHAQTYPWCAQYKRRLWRAELRFQHIAPMPRDRERGRRHVHQEPDVSGQWLPISTTLQAIVVGGLGPVERCRRSRCYRVCGLASASPVGTERAAGPGKTSSKFASVTSPSVM